MYTAPRTRTEGIISDIWSEILGVDSVGIHDSFFYLGGDTLKVARVISRLRSMFQVEVSFDTFFKCPTIAEISPLIEVMLMHRS